MNKAILAALFLSLPQLAPAKEPLCPVDKDQPWDKMEEAAFSKENVKAQLAKLQEYFDGDIIVAEEFIYQSTLIIEGAAIRQSVEYWKQEGNRENMEYWIEQFCTFMKDRAYLVH